MKFVVRQDVATALWHWELQADGDCPVATSGAGFKSMEELLESVHAVRAGAASTLVFDVLGRLQEGA